VIVKLFPIGRTFGSYINKVLRHKLRGQPMPPVRGIAQGVDQEGNIVRAFVEVQGTVREMSVYSPEPPEDVVSITIPAAEPPEDFNRSEKEQGR
jgi:hypothetical protein